MGLTNTMTVPVARKSLSSVSVTVIVCAVRYHDSESEVDNSLKAPEESQVPLGSTAGAATGQASISTEPARDRS